MPVDADTNSKLRQGLDANPGHAGTGCFHPTRSTCFWASIRTRGGSELGYPDTNFRADTIILPADPKNKITSSPFPRYYV